jgi:DNA-binding Xre family transcriptional regulator
MSVVLFRNMDTMAKRIDAAMKANGISVQRLMAATGLSRSGVYFLLDGTTTAAKIRAVTVMELCKTLKLTPERLLYGKESADALTTEERFGRVAGNFEQARLALFALVLALEEKLPGIAGVYSDKLGHVPLTEDYSAKGFQGLLSTAVAEIAKSSAAVPVSVPAGVARKRVARKSAK